MSESNGNHHIELRQLSIEHFEDISTLMQFAFQYKQSEEELKRSRSQFEEEPITRYGAFVDGKLAAHAAVLELETFVGGNRIAMGGVAAVATWPEYRRQGLVANLLVHALEEMRAKGQSLSFLHPFNFGFYRKFGWEIYTEHKVYTIQSELLPARAAYEGRVERYSGNYSLLNQIYEAYAARFNGTLVRTELWWKYRISHRKPGQIAVYYDKNDLASGYLIYEVKNMCLQVHEMVYLHEEARKGLWSFITQHDSMLTEVKITVPANDVLPYLLPNPRIKQEIIPYFMGRIVDAERFIGQYRFNPDSQKDDIPITLADKYAPWNEGSYTLQIEPNGSAALIRHDDEEHQNDAICVDIGTFTAMLLGYVRPLQLSQLERIHGKIEFVNRLHSRIPEQTTYLPDFF